MPVVGRNFYFRVLRIHLRNVVLLLLNNKYKWKSIYMFSNFLGLKGIYNEDGQKLELCMAISEEFSSLCLRGTWICAADLDGYLGCWKFTYIYRVERNSI
jgi:hypothetical protein